MILNNDLNIDEFLSEVFKDIENGKYDEFGCEVPIRKGFRGNWLLSKLQFEYYREKLHDMLIEKDYIKSDQIASSLIYVTCAIFLREITEPLIHQKVNEEIEKINKLITQFTLTVEKIHGRNIFQKYDELGFIHFGLTYEEESPFIVFQDFLEMCSINFRLGNSKYNFKYALPNELQDDCKEVFYYCNDINEMLSDLESRIMDKLTKGIIESIDDTNVLVEPFAFEVVDKTILENCKDTKELYTYLRTLDSARINLNLSWLYLLLYHNSIPEFTDKNLTKQVKQSLHECELEENEIKEKRGVSYIRIYKLYKIK